MNNVAKQSACAGDGESQEGPVSDFAPGPAHLRSFGAALNALKAGDRVARKGWNGKGMWLVLVGAGDYAVSEDLAPGCFERGKLLPWIGMSTADGCFVPWLASQTDILAHDWVVLA